MIKVLITPDELAGTNDAGRLMHIHRRLTSAGIPVALNLGRGELICPCLQADADHNGTLFYWPVPGGAR
jgi:hypothetical protein